MTLEGNMKCNVGKAEKIVRSILGLIILGIGIAYMSWWGALGAVLLITAAIGWCPINRVLGIDTCKEKT